MFGIPFSLAGIGLKLLGAGKWLAAHPLQVAIAALAVVCYVQHSRLGTLRLELAAVCTAVDAKPNCNAVHDVAAVVVSRDAFKVEFAQAQANYKTAKTANATLAASLADALEVNRANLKTKADAEDRARVALAQLQAAKRTIAAANARDRQIRESLYVTDPTCSSWALQPVCPGVDRFLRTDPAGPATPATRDRSGDDDSHARGAPLPPPTG